MTQTVLVLVETQPMPWPARFTYLAAREERERLEDYAKDLLWLAVKSRYKDLPQPSKVAQGKARDTRTAKQIAADIVRKLTGRRN